MMKRIVAFFLLLFAGLWCLQQAPTRAAGWLPLAQSGAVVYSGPGNVIAGATLFGSCARAYTLALATTTTNLCDLVAVTGGAAVCTIRASSTGTVDLTSYCPGSLTPSAACAAASGGSCKVTKVYDQSGNGNHLIQATLATMPAITFSLQNGLPGIVFTKASSQQVSSGALSLTQPFTVSWVGQRSSVTDGQNPGLFGWNVSQYFNAANTSYFFDGSVSANFTIADNTNVAIMDLFNSPAGASTSAAYLNGSALSTTLTLSGASDTGGNPWTLGCANGCGDFFGGNVFEIAIWTGNQSGSAAALSTEQRNTTYGYNF